MSKRGSYLGGNSVIRVRAPTSSGKKQHVGVLNHLAAYNASVGPKPVPPKPKRKPAKP